jgi:signal transduction histidine kinase
VLDRVPVHVADLEAETGPAFAESRTFQQGWGIRSMLAVPMLREGVPLGVILLRRTEVRPFDPREIELVQTFANQAAVALENARLFDQLGAKNRELTDVLERQNATSEILRVILRSPADIQPVFDAILESAARLCDGEQATAYRFDGERQHFVAHFNMPREVVENLQALFPRVPDRGAVTGLAILDRVVVHVHDILADARFNLAASSIEPSRSIRTVVAVPMLRDGEPLGALFVSRGGDVARPFSEAEIGLLQTFADQAVIAIENVRLFNELETRTRELAQSLDETRGLNEVTHAVGASVDLRQILRTVIHHAVWLSASDGGLVTEIDRRGDVFDGVAAHGLSDEFLRYLRTTSVDWRTSVVPPGTQPGQPWEIPDIAEAKGYAFREMLLREGFRAQLDAPIPGVERVIRGIVVFRRAPGRFEPRVVDLLMALANQSKVAIENAALFQAIEDKSRQVEAATRAKSQFLANMSHELRTPLNAIIGYTELALEQTYGEVPDKLVDILERVEKSSRHLLGLINEVLDLSKIEAGQLTLSLDDYALRDVVHSVCLSMEALAAEKGLALRATVAPDLPLARGDERRLTQVLLNLVGNAVKFTETGHVAIEASRDGDALVVAVSDTGPGISAADHERIFEEFQQADASDTRRKGGTGLGLAIARRIVALHGGRLWVESAPGRGSTFRLTVPVRVEQQAETP